MSEFDFVVVGAGSAGAVVAARLSEDRAVRVALLEAGKEPPAEELMPAACPAMQRNPETDWDYTGDAGGAGLGLEGQRMMVPRGKMLGGCSGINYMAYVRGHPGDFDAWAEGGAEGWSYADVLPYFKKSEGLVPSDDIAIDRAAHGTDGPLGVSVRQPVLPGAQAFVAAVEASGIPRGDYNGQDRQRPEGVVSLFQTTTKDGKRQSTYRSFLGEAVRGRDNLTIIVGAHATEVLLEATDAGHKAQGVAYIDGDGNRQTVRAAREVILCGGAVGSPQLLMLSGIGPRAELEQVGIECRLDAPHVGKHLKDHFHVAFGFVAKGAGVSMLEMGISMGPDALRSPDGPLPVDPADDEKLPPELAALKTEAERRLAEWFVEGKGLVSSSLYDAAAWYSTGLGDPHTHDAQISIFACGYNTDIVERCLRVDPNQLYANPEEILGPQAEAISLLANPVQPRSEGEVVLTSKDPAAHPEIRFNYLSDPHDLAVTLSIMRKVLDVVKHWPNPGQLSPLQMPPELADKHGFKAGDEPSDALLEDVARHYALTVYHLTSTCRIGEVVDAGLRVHGVSGLRVADASVMPNIVSGNTNAACIMIGEKAAELIARDHAVRLHTFVGP